jgi:PDZ domain-containing secreted protein
MKAFLQEVLAAIEEGPSLFFAPARAAIEAARSPNHKK